MRPAGLIAHRPRLHVLSSLPHVAVRICYVASAVLQANFGAITAAHVFVSSFIALCACWLVGCRLFRGQLQRHRRWSSRVPTRQPLRDRMANMVGHTRRANTTSSSCSKPHAAQPVCVCVSRIRFPKLCVISFLRSVLLSQSLRTQHAERRLKLPHTLSGIGWFLSKSGVVVPDIGSLERASGKLPMFAFGHPLVIVAFRTKR